MSYLNNNYNNYVGQVSDSLTEEVGKLEGPTWLSLGLMTSLTFYLGNQWIDRIEPSLP